jgi:steroid 5-alpha reductase family enzyme
MSLFGQSLIVIAAAMTLLWLVSLLRRDASIVDAFWGTGFILVVGFALLTTPEAQTHLRCWLLVSLVLVWGLRLSLHLLRRNLRHGQEDYRYRAMRDYHGPRFWWVSLFTVFLLQGCILWFVAMPVLATIKVSTGRDLGVLDAIGVAVWLVGFFFESVGDYQLAGFLKDPQNAGRVMNRGLWKYTRHPNYFGDFCVWWGLYLISIRGGAAWTIFAPLLMSFLLIKVSGVRLLEKTVTTRRPEYADYQARTSAFFPWPPRRD